MKPSLVFKFIIIFIGTFGVAYAQDKVEQFIINGSINADTGSIELITLGDSSYYPSRIHSKSEVKNGKFTLAGTLSYPQGVMAKYNGNMISGLFLIDKGKQLLKLDINDFRKTPVINNEVMREYYGDYLSAFKASKIKSDMFYHHWDSLRKAYDGKVPENIEVVLRKTQNELYQQSDSILMRYIASHPGSYLGLWKLVQIASFSGYEPIFDTAFEKLSPTLKATFTGRQLANRLSIGRSLAVGKRFPEMNVFNLDKQPLKATSKHRFTLVDFWYSNCSPCIAQFPKLDSIYNGFHDKGFEIIGISTDKRKYELQWRNAIAQHNLAWPQYWDTDGVNASRYSINAFPTNFLLNSDQEIVSKNISPVELEAFLKGNIR
ncbi:redoxin domain-containing protein [Paradesertivirga mongoliensis]|uniref:Redoxin domain-containing protein n=1 Tax=Paradesertivirga mongoliensis TaxID=2100740 RepID=A0ABW4ZG16_9SPHI|nr:TlpA disulfide reductase family protein [Pedobacter mongoliensis]